VLLIEPILLGDERVFPEGGQARRARRKLPAR
jgi:hypothetical protein